MWTAKFLKFKFHVIQSKNFIYNLILHSYILMPNSTLEQSDFPPFSRYEFVKALRNRLDEELGNLIDEEIELHAMGRKDAGYEELVEQISEKVIASREWVFFPVPWYALHYMPQNKELLNNLYKVL